jgi:asparagine synthase (glutamine-hydrolysing)
VSLSESEPNVFQYWNSSENALEGVKNQFEGGPEDAVDALDILLKDAVGRQMVADVPLGAFLSGGVDSSTVVALMQSQSSLPVKTFTIGYGESKYSEAAYAKAVARYLGTDHTELYVTPEQAMQVITKLPTMYCEPFADSSQIPTFLVSQLAKQHVTVSLSGDAGDELFCGYNRYQLTSNLWPTISRMPTLLRSSIAKSITSIPPHVLSRFFSFLPWASIGDKLHKGANVIGSRNLDELYLGMVSSWLEPDSIVIQDLESAELTIAKPSLLMGLNDVERMMVFDTLSYLPDDILVKVDRAAMSNSLEVRAPFLDHRVFDFAWRLPIEYKLRNMQTKWILRQLLYRYVPPELIDRPKMGFGFPVDIWLRGPLREWAENLLNDVRLRQEGYLNPNLIRKKWNEHLSGKRNWSSQLWSVLMFQVWLEEELK